ncbi:MAG TPA: hypothetical protein VMU85_05775, partial [Stellaceae bacterium]|nr:hypothetical protein [Stellaceae bacterium]
EMKDGHELLLPASHRRMSAWHVAEAASSGAARVASSAMSESRNRVAATARERARFVLAALDAASGKDHLHRSDRTEEAA